MAVTRRQFLRTTAVGGGAITLGGAGLVRPGLAQVLPKSSGKRLVVVGAGFGGNFAALTVKRLVPDAEVVLVDRSAFFISCPATLEYVFGLASLDTITFGYSPLIARGVKVIRTEVVAVEPDQKRVVTGHGALDYDQLLLATGIRLALDFLSQEDLDRGYLFTILRNADAAAKTGHEWLQIVVARGLERVMFDSRPHSLTRPVLRARLLELARSKRFLQRKSAVRALWYLREQGSLLALANGKGPEADFARAQHAQVLKLACDECPNDL